MKIFGYEIRKVRFGETPKPASETLALPMSDAELAGAFRVNKESVWFRAVLQIIDDYERELITESRSFVGETNKCLNAVGGGAGLEVLRSRFCSLREQAVKGQEKAEGGRRKAE